jgi:hypothetical protein
MLDDLQNIKNDIRDYFEVRLDQLKLHTAENISRILSNTANLVIIGYLMFFILLFLSIAGGYFFGTLFNSNELGFLCITGFYLLILLIFLFYRKKLVDKPIIQAIVKLFFPKTNNHEEEF